MRNAKRGARHKVLTRRRDFMETPLMYLVILLFLSLNCSELRVEWVCEFKPAGLGNYEINSIEGFKNFYATGSYTRNNQNPICIIAEYREKGKPGWFRLYENKDFRSNTGKAILVSRENGLEQKIVIYVLLSAVDTEGINYLILVKYDSLGNFQWERVVQKSLDEIDGIVSVDRQGNISIIGWQEGLKDSITVFITKYFPSGTQIWLTKYSQPNLRATSLKFRMSKSNQYLVGGVLKDFRDFFFIRFDSLGQFLNFTRYENAEAETILSDMAVDDQGNIYLTGISQGADTKCDYLTFRYDDSNNLCFARRYDGFGLGDDMPRALIVDESLSVYITGCSKNERGLNEILTLKYDKDGNILWTNKFSGRENESVGLYSFYSDIFSFTKRKTYGHLYITSLIGKEIVLLKYDFQGRFYGICQYKLKGDENRLTAQVGSVVVLKSKIKDRTKIVLVKFGRFKIPGIMRWD